MAVRAAVLLSERYLSGRFLPDKAIDLLDEAGAKARISMMHQPPQLTQLEGQIEEARVAKEESIGRQEYEKAAKLRDTEKNLRDDLQRQRSDWESHKDENQPIVDEEDIANIVAKQTGIPVTRLTEGETQKVLKMEDALRTKIIGQDEALSTVCRAIRRSRADIK
ncbi:MAG: ATP-dependent Clp protease ATP-binding protein, partial [Parachlamydiales bacterium]|nr:ATP-dependent Clp protease ATP-binding protein [Parachlamydiales bacterium]